MSAITIYTKSGLQRYSAPITQDAEHVSEIMKEHYVQLVFNASLIEFAVGDYIMYEQTKFSLLELPKPVRNGVAWKYDIQFHSFEASWKNCVMFFMPESGAKESEWTLTSKPETFIEMAVKNINRFFGTNVKVGTILTAETQSISFANLSVWDALSQIAEAFDTEWHFDGEYLYLNKYEFGSGQELMVDKQIQSASGSKGDDKGYATRIYPYGSTRNIIPETSSTATNSILNNRLKLANLEYIDSRENLPAEEIIEAVVIFEDIYPRMINKAISAVRFKEQTINDTKQNVYYFKIANLGFNPSDLILPGMNLSVKFESGNLNGREFELNYNTTTLEFEILNKNETDSIIIPNASLCPTNGDVVVLFNLQMPDSYKLEAQAELLKTAQEYILESSKDRTVYTCPANPVHCSVNDIDYQIGQKVVLKGSDFGADRESRIQRTEKKLYNKYICTYQIGDNATYSRLNNIERDARSANYAISSPISGGGSKIAVITKYDTTKPQDTNVYSALRAGEEFLKTNEESIAKEFIKFLKGINVTGGFTADKITASLVEITTKLAAKLAEVENIDVSDTLSAFRAELTELSATDSNITNLIFHTLKQAGFTEGVLGKGMGLSADGETLYLEKLIVKKSALFIELIIQKLRAQGGQTVLSGAGHEITGVEEFTNYWKVYFEGTNEFTVGSLPKIQNFNGNRIGYLWSECIAIGANYIHISRINKDGDYTPQIGDNIVQFGHKTDISQQNIVLLSAVNNQVGLFTYRGVNSFSLSGKAGPWIGQNGDQVGIEVIVDGKTIQSWTKEVITTNLQQSSNSTNLLPNSGEFVDTDKWSSNNTAPTVVIVNKELEIGFTNNAENSGYGISSIPLKAGHEYTVAINYEIQGTGGVFLSVVKPYTYYAVDTANLTGNTEFIRKFTPSQDGNFRVMVYKNGSAATTNLKIKIKNITLVEGDYFGWSQNSAYLQERSNTAKQLAQDAQTTASSATSQLSDISSDNKLTASEKIDVKGRVDAIKSEYVINLDKAVSYNVSTIAYTGAYNTLVGYIDPLLSVSGTSDIDRNTFNTKFKSYYDANINLLNSISDTINGKVNTTNTNLGALESSYNAYVANTNNKFADVGLVLEDLQSQIDGNITMYNGEEVPTLSNYPANEWLPNEYESHIGDIYNRTYMDVLGNLSIETYKFSIYNTTYQWIIVADSQAAEAYQKANEALQLAGSKNRCSFGETPSIPYIVNDLWVKTDGSIYLCNAARNTFQESDWDLANNATIRLAKLADDNTITIEEKVTINKEFNQINKEFNQYKADAITYNVSVANLTTAFNNLNTFLFNTVKIGFKEDTELTAPQQSDYNTCFANWYAEVSRFSNKVATAISQQAVNEIQIGGVNLLNGTNIACERPSSATNNNTQIQYTSWSDELLSVLQNHEEFTLSADFDVTKTTDDFTSYIEIFYRYKLNESDDTVNQAGFSVRKTETFKGIAYETFKVPLDRIVVDVAYTSATIGKWDKPNNGYGIIKNFQITKGNKVTTWSPSIVDTNNAISNAQTSADNAQVSADNLSEYVDGAFADGIISESEAIAISKYINSVNNTKQGVDAAYTELYSNSYLTGTAQSGLYTAKNDLNTATTNLINSINTAIADGKTTAAEKADVDSKFALFNAKLATFNTAVETANKSIQSAIKKASDTYTDKAVESMEVGTVNLLFNTSNFVSTNGYAISGATIEVVKDDLLNKNVLSLKKVSSNNFGGIIWSLSSQNLTLELNKEYTLKCRVKIYQGQSSNPNIIMALNGSGISGGKNVLTISDNNWHNVQATFTNTGVNTNPRVYSQSNSEIIMYITDMMFVEGNKVGDYDISPNERVAKSDYDAYTFATDEKFVQVYTRTDYLENKMLLPIVIDDNQTLDNYYLNGSTGDTFAQMKKANTSYALLDKLIYIGEKGFTIKRLNSGTIGGLGYLCRYDADGKFTGMSVIPLTNIINSTTNVGTHFIAVYTTKKTGQIPNFATDIEIQTCFSEQSVGSAIKQSADNILIKVGKSGIDVENNRIKATTDQFTIEDTNGNPNTVFETDASGNPILKAKHIDADNLTVGGVRYKFKEVAEINYTVIATSPVNIDGLNKNITLTCTEDCVGKVVTIFNHTSLPWQDTEFAIANCSRVYCYNGLKNAPENVGDVERDYDGKPTYNRLDPDHELPQMIQFYGGVMQLCCVKEYAYVNNADETAKVWEYVIRWVIMGDAFKSLDELYNTPNARPYKFSCNQILNSIEPTIQSALICTGFTQYATGGASGSPSYEKYVVLPEYPKRGHAIKIYAGSVQLSVSALNGFKSVTSGINWLSGSNLIIPGNRAIEVTFTGSNWSYNVL